jgi:hypothetical protein
VIALLVVLWSLAGCGPVEVTCEDLYGAQDLLDLRLTEEHSGWGEPRCFTCHSAERMHRLDCTAVGDLDLASVRDLVAEEGIASCAACHGDNGVDP